MGVLFLVDHSIIGNNQFERLLDMLRKLRLSSSAGEAYDATCLVMAQAEGRGRARLRLDEVPDDLGLAQFFASMLTTVFTRLPVLERIAARHLHADGTAPTLTAQPPGRHAGPPPGD